MIRDVLMLVAAVGVVMVPLCAADTVIKSPAVKGKLIELYSSEGCSSCPPAESWVSKLKNTRGLWTEFFPVVFHVDYWDGLGWPDRFAQSAFTERQRNYASRFGQDSVYTPEFVVDGREWKGWFHSDQLPAAAKSSGGDLIVTVDEAAKKGAVTFTPESGRASQPYNLYVALLGVDLVTDVKRGENGGRILKHDFVVLDLRSTPLVSGPGNRLQSGELRFGSLNDKASASVAWVTDANGTIVQIAGGWLKSAGL